MISGQILCRENSKWPFDHERNTSDVSSSSDPSHQDDQEHFEKYSLFSHYNLTGNVFSNLHTINLSSNGLLLLPIEFGCLVTLKECYLSFNRFVTLPCTFENFERLTILHLNSNQITNMPSMMKMSQLQELDLYDNELKNFPRLPSSVKFLDIAQNLRELPDDDDYFMKMDNLRNKRGYEERICYGKAIISSTETSVESGSSVDDEEEEWEDYSWDQSDKASARLNEVDIWNAFDQNFECMMCESDEMNSQEEPTPSNSDDQPTKSDYKYPKLPVSHWQFEDDYLL